MRVAETRAVNRALRKAYGIGICSIEEIGSPAAPAETARVSEKLPPKPANGNGYGGPKVRNRLCQIVRQHQLDATLVKSYATDFCGVKNLREATREQVENFVVYLADWAEKHRNALLCQRANEDRRVLAWEQGREAERGTRFVELGRYLYEVRAGQYWRIEKLKSFDEFRERRFPESRRKAYYLMSIHEHLPPQARKDLKEIGWTKGRELAKLAREEGQSFDCAPSVHKARSMPREGFAREVEKELTARDSEPHEIIYFKIYRSQIPIIEQALETAGLMLGTDKSRGYCLEMICADFLAGANLDGGHPEVLLQFVVRFFNFLPNQAAT